MPSILRNLPVVPATGNYLKPNGHGGYIISASSLASWARCSLAKYYDDRARYDPEAPQPAQLSATVYGSVMHYALQILEKAVHEKHDDPLGLATRTFTYYWHPSHIEELDGVKRVTEWLPRQTWNGLLERGQRALRDYYDLRIRDESWLLALEYPFAVPIEVGGRLHTLHGFVDKLAIRAWYRKPYVSLDDFKTGKQPSFLRWNIQGTMYAAASLAEEFWTGWPESGVSDDLPAFDASEIRRVEKVFASHGYRLHDRSPNENLPLASRRFRWVNLQELKYADGGWRNLRDVARLALAIDGYVKAYEAEAYTVNATGEVCAYCEWKHDCGGVGLPGIEDGKP